MSDTTDQAVNTEVATQEPTTTDSAPAEQQAPEVTEFNWDDDDTTPPEPKEQSPTEPEGEPEQPEAAEEEVEHQPQGKAEERKQQLNTDIRDLVAQRNALRTEVERLNSQAYGVPTEEELVEQGYSELEAKVEAMQQQQNLERYNSQVADAQLTLDSESSKVMNDFPMFNPESDDYNEAVHKEAAELLQQSLITDPNTGQVVGSNVSPYKLFQTIAMAHESSARQNRIEGQRAAQRMLASADNVGNAAPPKQKSDPLLDLWKD